VLAYLASTLGIGIYFAATWQWKAPLQVNAYVHPFPAYVQGHIVELLQSRPPVLRCVVDGAIDAQNLPPIQARILLHVTGTTGYESWLFPGQTIRATVRIRPPQQAWLPTDFPEWDYCAHLNVQWVAFAQVHNIASWTTETGFLEHIQRWVALQRQRLRELITKLYSPETRGLATALLLGDRSELTAEQRWEFAVTGTSHVLAISGLHVGVLAAMVLVLVGFLQWRWLQWLVFSVTVSLFVVLTGAQPSALRAGIMASLGWALYLAQRQAHPTNVVAAVAVLLLLIAPELVFSRSFQLSVLATLGIVSFYTPFSEWLKQYVRWLPSGLVQGIALTLAATCTSAPVAALSFGTFSLLSVPLNLLAVPLSSIALVAGILGLLIYPVSPMVGSLYSSTAQTCLQWLMLSTHHAAQLPITALEGTAAAVVAFASSASFLWLLTARRWLHGVTRLAVVGTAALLLSIGIAPRREAVLIPRERLVVALLPTSANSTLVVLVDRLPRRKPRPDPALERYLHSLPGRVQIAFTGYTGEVIAVRCARARSADVTVIPAPSSLLAYIQRLFRQEIPLAQSVVFRRAA